MHDPIEHPHGPGETGLFNAGYTAFLETVVHLRSRLHRYCTRMTGSSLDGEDVMQESLFEAYRKLDLFEEGRSMQSWLFRIVHNRCIDFLRRKKMMQRAETEMVADGKSGFVPADPIGLGLKRAIEYLVIGLPPKERACVLLKDVFDYSLEETADLVDSTVGGVKAALSRGRSKLAMGLVEQSAKPAASPQLIELLNLYVERFNRRDWDGVRELASADARLQVADCFAGQLSDSPYFVEYETPIIPWRMVIGEVDGELVVVVMVEGEAGSAPYSCIRIVEAEGRVTAIRDYIKTEWVLEQVSEIKYHPVSAGST